MDKQEGQTFGQYLKAYFKNFKETLKHPLTLLPTAVLAVIWIVFGIVQARNGESQALAVFNFFTFAQGGLFGGVVGAIGGIVGKILIATLVTSLVMPLVKKGSRPFARFGKGVKGLFGSFAFDSLRALSVFLWGMGLALLLYSVFNITQRWQESIVGLAGAILLIRSIGQRGGFLFSILFSIVSAFSKGKTPSYIGVSRFLSGMATGMTVGFGINVFGLRWCLVFAAGSLVLALVFVFFGKKQRAALSAASIVALLLVPVYAQTPQKKEQEKELNSILGKANDAGNLANDLNGMLSQIQAAGANDDYSGMEKIGDQMMDKLNAGDLNSLMGMIDNMDMSQFEGMEGFDDEEFGEEEYGNPGIPEGTISDNIGGLFAGAKGNKGEDAGKEKTVKDDDEDEDEEEDSSDNGFVETMTEGFADESSYVDDEGEAGVLEGIGAVGGALGAAGAAGAGAGSAAAAGGGGGGGTGGGTPDLPDSPDLSEGPEKETGKDEEDEEEEKTEGGGDDDDKEPYEGTDEDPQPGDEEGFEEEEEKKEEPSEGTDEDPQPGDEEGFEEEDEKKEDEEEKSEEEAEEKEPYEGTDEDPQPGDEEGFEEEEETDNQEEETEELSEEEYQQKMEEYEKEVADLEREREERAKQQEETDKKYKDEFDKDAEKYQTTSSEEKIREASEKHMKEEEAQEDERIRQDKVIETAQKHGVDTNNPDGTPKDIKQLQDETVKKIVEDRHWGNYKDELFVQQLLNDEELEYSLLEADASYIDEVSENSVNVLGEVVPGGRCVKNGHNFLKAVGKNVSEAHAKGESMGKAAIVGAGEGSLSILQNQAGDIKWAKYGGKVAQLAGEATAVIGAEGAKVLLHELANGTSPQDALDKALTATGQKAAYFAGNKMYGKLTQGLTRLGGFDKELGKFIQKSAEAGLTEGVHNYAVSDKVKDVMESFENFRDEKAGDILGLK